MQAAAENTRPPVRGVIDTVSAGYTLVGRHPWLIAIPIVLDLLLWAGPRLGIAPLIADFLRVTATPADLGPEYAETLQIARDSLTAMGQSFNLLGLLAAGFLGIPTIIGAGTMGRDLLPMAPPVFELTSWLALLPAVPLLMLASVWIAAVYLAPLAQMVRDDAVTPATAARQIWMAGWRLTVWVGVLLGVIIAVGVPVMLLAGLFMVLNAGVASFFTGLIWISLMWVALYLFFVVESITVGQAGVFRSILEQPERGAVEPQPCSRHGDPGQRDPARAAAGLGVLCLRGLGRCR